MAAVIMTAFITAFIILLFVGAAELAKRDEARPEYAGGLALDPYTCRIIREEIAAHIDELEKARNVGDVSGLCTALAIVQELESDI